MSGPVRQLEVGGEVADPDWPWVNCDGEPLSCDDDKINKLVGPGDFVRLASLVVKEQQYAKFASKMDGARVAKYFIMDYQTASLVVRQWGRMAFGTRRKLLKLVKNKGPIYACHLFWSAVK